MSGAPCAQAVLHAADASLEALLRDVLGDIGIELRRPGEPCARPDVVLALVQRGDSLPRVLETAGAARAPVEQGVCLAGVSLGRRWLTRRAVWRRARARWRNATVPRCLGRLDSWGGEQ